MNPLEKIENEPEKKNNGNKKDEQIEKIIEEIPELAKVIEDPKKKKFCYKEI